jgi:hypothetical protein
VQEDGVMDAWARGGLIINMILADIDGTLISLLHECCAEILMVARFLLLQYYSEEDFT